MSAFFGEMTPREATDSLRWFAEVVAPAARSAARAGAGRVPG
jgi:hypothetical protein